LGILGIINTNYMRRINMPQVRIKGITPESVKLISKEIIDSIATLTGCPREHVEIDVILTRALADNLEIEANPFVEVYWFDRGQEITDKVAKALTKLVQTLGIQNIDIAFHLFQKNLYYENGEHF
jgi:hypothetical protein